MSLFHGYNELPKPDNLVTMPITPCKTTVFNPKGNKKPKGLSMRSNSDMNVFHSTLLSSAKENIYNSKELKNSKPKTVKLDNSGLQTHSLKEQWKLTPNCEHLNGEFVGPQTSKIDKTKKKEEVSDDKIFKKPLLPKKFKKQICKPENLAHFYDTQYEFEHGYVETMEQGFMGQLLKEKENVIPYEEKDSATLLSVEIPKLILPSSFDEEYIGLSSPELPYVSDDDSV